MSKKNSKVLSKSAIAAALSISAVVPVAAIPAAAAELPITEVIYNIDGKLVAIDVATFESAANADVLKDLIPDYVKTTEGKYYTFDAFTEAVNALEDGATIDGAIELLNSVPEEAQNLENVVVGDVSETGEVVPPATTELKVESVSAINPTTIKVTFNVDPKEADLATSNFSLSKGTIESVKATGKEVTLSVKGLTYGNETTVTVGNPAHTATVKVPEVSEVFMLEVTTDAPDDTIKSDGAQKTQITVTLKDRATGEVVKKDGIVQFQATRGGLGQTTSALQDGKASVQLTSVASATSQTSIVTATVSDVPGAAEFEGLTAQKAVIFSPDAVQDNTKFVQAMKAESTQGDRLHVQFSDKISAAAYKKAIADKAAIKGKPTSVEYGINIDGKAVAVKDVVNVTENTLEFILDVDSLTGTGHQRIENTTAWTGVPAAATQKNYLRDNVTHTVTFPSNVGEVVRQTQTGINFILTDTSRPAVLGVTAKDQLNFTVRYTESVDERTVEPAAAWENFLLDGRKVKVIAAPTAGDIAKAKADNEIILTSLKVGEYTFDKEGKAVDARNLENFTIHKDFALTAGTHQIQIANVGDWAVDVDPGQNKVATDTFDFTVSVDNSVPAPTIEVQSPEQWKVTFDKNVYGTTGKTVKDVFALKTADTNDTLVMDTDYIVSYINEDGTVGTKLNPSDSASKLDGQKYFLIEFKQDWTAKYNTANNSLKTYFASTKNPYTVTIENLESATGNKIAKQDLNVNLSYDGQSPEIANAQQVTDKVTGQLTSDVRVKMSEPVKNVVAASNNEGLTPSQQQTNDGGVPVPTYEFVKGDKVVKATAKDASYDNYGFTLTPASTLEAGEWTLYIRSISDDIGNTSATVSQKVTIVQPAQTSTNTQIAWAAFDDADGTGKLVPGSNNDPNNDVIYVKFTKVMNSEGANGVSRTQNYVFRGQPLPAGSQVVKGIKGVTTDWDGVTIIMPKDSWDGVADAQNDFGAAFNVANNFVSADGEALSGAYEVELKDTATIKAGSALNGAVEGLYKAENSGTFGNVQATTIGAEATGADGKVKAVELTFEEAVSIKPNTEIRVNGKEFINVAGTTTNKKATFTAKTGQEVEGTATTGLVITAVDGAILINKDSVVDKVAPIITKAALNAANDKLTVTFSENIKPAVVASTTLTPNGTGTLDAANAVEIGDNYLVFNVGTSFVANDTIDVAAAQSVIKDLAGNNAAQFEGATTTNDVKVTGINTAPGATTTGVTATSATQGTPAVATVPEVDAIWNTGAITPLANGATGTFIFDGVTITVKSVAGPVADTGTAVSATAGTVEVLDGASAADTATAIVAAFDAVKATHTTSNAASYAFAVDTNGVKITAIPTIGATKNTEKITGSIVIAEDEVVTPGVTANLGSPATATFKIATGATKTGAIKVTIKETVGGTTTKVADAVSVNVTAGMTPAQVAQAIAGTAGLTTADIAVTQVAATNELLITQVTPFEVATYEVEITN